MMISGKNLRMDNRRSSSYSSTVTLVVFVALCLVGVWMTTTTTVVPVDFSTPDNKPDVKEQVSVNDSPTQDASKGDANTGSNIGQEETSRDVSQRQGAAEKDNEIKEQGALQENPAKKSEERKDGSEDTSKDQTYSDENGKGEGAESNKDGGDVITDGEGGSQEKKLEKTSGGTGNSNEEEFSEQNESTNNEKQNNQDENNSSVEHTADEKVQGQIEEKVEETESKDTEQNSEENSEENSAREPTQDEKVQDQMEQKVEETESKDKDQNSGENKTMDQVSNEMLPDPAQSELLNETNTQSGSWATQATESKKEKEAQRPSNGEIAEYSWKLCNVSAGPDYIPCLDNVDAIMKLRTTKHYEHRERHCPEQGPTCLVPLPEGYKQPIKWPSSRDKVWYANVPHTKLAEIKGHQNWVKTTGEFLTFPGGGTQFKHGALHYIDFIQESLPNISWGKRSRVVLDVGCGVASFGGFLFERDVLTMSFAPKDEHEAQVQFALERGIPAISAVMGTKRLPYPSRVFDVIHCARCRVPWHIDGGMLLLELNRLLRPGGYFVWSATPVYRKLPEDAEIWKAMSQLTKSMCWEMVTKRRDPLEKISLAIYKKPSSNDCYERRAESNPPLCQDSDDPNAAWNVQLQACMHKVPVDPSVRGSQWPKQWPERLETPPYWLNGSQLGVYGQAAPEDFKVDYKHWKRVVSMSYLKGMGVNWSTVRNVMDMRSVYGGFAVALRDMKVWVMNVVSIESADTLPIIYERGLFGIYHDWCESFNTYPRTYDLLHADHLFSKTKKRCNLLSVLAEVDRILRPEGKMIVRDDVETIEEVDKIARSLKWQIRMTYSKENEGLLCVQKTMWRPQEVETTT